MNPEDESRLKELTRRRFGWESDDPKAALIRAMFETYGDDTGQDMRIPGHSSLPDGYIPLLESIVGKREDMGLPESSPEPDYDLKDDEILLCIGDKPFATIEELRRAGGVI